MIGILQAISQWLSRMFKLAKTITTVTEMAAGMVVVKAEDTMGMVVRARGAGDALIGAAPAM